MSLLHRTRQPLSMVMLRNIITDFLSPCAFILTVFLSLWLQRGCDVFLLHPNNM